MTYIKSKSKAEKGEEEGLPGHCSRAVQLILMLLLSIATAACWLQEHEDAFGMTLWARGQASRVVRRCLACGSNKPQRGFANAWGAMQSSLVSQYRTYVSVGWRLTTKDSFHILKKIHLWSYGSDYCDGDTSLSGHGHARALIL